MPKIAVIGNSSLAYFVAREFDREFARQVENEVVFIRSSKDIVHTIQAGKFDSNSIDVTKHFLHVSFEIASIKSINLGEKRLVTSESVQDYDYLFVDQTPVYTATELLNIAYALRTVEAQLNSRKTQKEATYFRIAVKGTTVSSYQVALSAKQYFNRHSIRNVTVEAELPAEEAVIEFLEHEGINHLSSRRQPGITIAAPHPPVNNRKVRSLHLDLGERAVVDQFGSPTHHPKVIYIDNEIRQLTNLWKSDQALAKQLAGSLIKEIETGKKNFIPEFTPAFSLSGKFIWLSDQISTGLRAKAVIKLDLSLFKKLSRDR